MILEYERDRETLERVDVFDEDFVYVSVSMALSFEVFYQVQCCCDDFKNRKCIELL